MLGCSSEAANTETHSQPSFFFFRTASFTPHDGNLNDLAAVTRGDLLNFQFAAILPDDAFILIVPADFSETALRPEETRICSKHTDKCHNAGVPESGCAGSVVKQSSVLLEELVD